MLIFFACAVIVMTGEPSVFHAMYLSLLFDEAYRTFAVMCLAPWLKNIADDWIRLLVTVHGWDHVDMGNMP